MSGLVDGKGICRDELQNSMPQQSVGVYRAEQSEQLRSRANCKEAACRVGPIGEGTQNTQIQESMNSESTPLSKSPKVDLPPALLLPSTVCGRTYAIC